MKENLAVIPLKEYRELLEIKEKIASAFEEKETMLRVSQQSFPGFSIRGFYIVNQDDVVNEMNKEMKILQERVKSMSEWYEEYKESIRLAHTRKWYQFIPMKRRY